jgi:heme-degrading monooxygenase HmoA
VCGSGEVVAPPVGGAPPSQPASLVTYGQSRTQKNHHEWNRQQKRVFQRLTSWCFEAVGRGCSLNRVDLTTAPFGPAHLLRPHLQLLRRRVERVFGFKGIEVFCVETSEGNGVLHMVWAWQGEQSFYIPQAWLSLEWQKIHGAPIAFIRKMRCTKKDIQSVGGYFALQYLSDQRGALVRMSWSWWRSRVALSRGWETLKKMGRVRSEASVWCGCSPTLYSVSMADVILAWESLLRSGEAMLGETLLIVKGRQVVEVC